MAEEQNGTTIWVTQSTKDKLNNAKIHPRETYDDVINRVLRDDSE
jgi:hypothetical protein